MKTEGTIFIFEWMWVLYGSFKIQEPECRKRTNKYFFYKIICTNNLLLVRVILEHSQLLHNLRSDLFQLVYWFLASHIKWGYFFTPIFFYTTIFVFLHQNFCVFYINFFIPNFWNLENFFWKIGVKRYTHINCVYVMAHTRKWPFWIIFKVGFIWGRF